MKAIVPIRDIQLDGLVSNLNVNTAIYMVGIKKLLIERNTHIRSDTESKDLTLDQVLLCMLYDFNDSYTQFNIVPPGIDKTIALIHQILECNNEERIQLMSGDIFKDNVAIAMAQVDSVKSGFNYVKAGLKIINAIAIFVASTVAFLYAGVFFGLATGVFVVGGAGVFGATVEAFGFIGLLYLAPILASICPMAMIEDATNQINRTSQANTNAGGVNGFGLFKTMSLKTSLLPDLNHYGFTR